MPQQGLLLALVCLAVLALPAASSPYGPHTPDGSRESWFEGCVAPLQWQRPCAQCPRPLPRLPRRWYMRVLTDAGASAAGAPASFGAIAGYVPARRAAGKPNATLAELILQPAGGAPAQISARTDLELTVSAGAWAGGGHGAGQEPGASALPRFAIRSGDGSLAWVMEGEECSVALAIGSTRIHIECDGPPVPWGGAGPEGEWGGPRACRAAGQLLGPECR